MSELTLPNNTINQTPLISKSKLILFVLFGFGFYLFMLISSILLSIICIVLAIRMPYLIKLAFIPIGSAYFFLKELFVRTPDPEGLRVTEKEVPELFKLIKETSKLIQTKKIDCVYIDSNLNAAVSETGRLFIPFLRKRTLTLGLELLITTTPNEFQSILAHELSHLSKKHARFNNFIYRNRKRLIAFADRIAQKKSWNPIKKFLLWYLNRFNQYTFAYSRINEFEADRNAANYFGNETTAQALIRTSVMNQYMNEIFWLEIWRMANDHSLPVNAYHQLLKLAKKPMVKEAFDKMLSNRLKETSIPHDTHPCLSERLKALQVATTDLQPIHQSAIEVYFNHSLNKIFEYFNHQWSNIVLTNWQNEYQERQQLKNNISLYENNQHLNPDQLESYAYAVNKLYGDTTKAAELLQSALVLNPEHGAANWSYALLLSKNHDDTCIEYFARIDKQKPRYAVYALREIIHYLIKTGRKNEIQPYIEQLEKEENVVRLAQQERSFIQNSDHFSAPNLLSDEEKQAICNLFCSDKNIKKAYLVEKTAKHFIEEKIYIVVVKIKLFRKINPTIIERLQNLRLSSGSLDLFILNWKRRRLFKQIKKVGLLLSNSITSGKHRL